MLRATDSDDQNVSIAYKLFSEKNWDECNTIKDKSMDVMIEFVGVWYASFFNVTEILGI